MPIASVASNDSTAGNVSTMATLTIRRLDDTVRDRLRQRRVGVAIQERQAIST
ncbi:hypothetical protein KR52_08535 [Synechococcus sp. KORDI-52]|uniref:hypothetical protein n=1 Tax=Synechococcus sp. KORDI-52 TaxID=585425 RepID=UPI0004E09D32|nr:hypothetical protein [Synechococcus sp. KORDI-52]AII49188.1 hypothetical protein KR52_08535 [Synechococcus sp. KORDI-52]